MGVFPEVDDVTSTIVSDCQSESTGTLKECFYSVADLQKRLPWRRDCFTTQDRKMRLWVGPGSVNVLGKTDQNSKSLATFYAIYLPSTQVYGSPGNEANLTNHLTALKGNLNLCVISYWTNVTYGITKTEEVSRVTDLTWQTAQKTLAKVVKPVISTTIAGKDYWMTQYSRNAFQQYSSMEAFLR